MTTVMSDIQDLVQKIHDAPHKTVVAVAGAGSEAVAWLLGVSGASRTLLEVVVPYGRLSMVDLLGHEPEQFVSAATARDMARATYHRALELREDDSPVVGLACTATIATDRPKRGEHRACIAAWDESGVTQVELVLDKGKRDRTGEEEVVSRLLVQTLAESFGIPDNLDIGLTPVEHPDSRVLVHPSPVQRLLSGDVNSVSVYSDGRMAVDESLQGALLPGSFSPLHQGHQELARAAATMLNAEVAFEISVINVDKPPLQEAEIQRRLSQFTGKYPVMLTRAETFYKKARLFPGVPFVVGWDTAVRLVDPRYYGGDESAMLTALAEIWATGSRFLVAGRHVDGSFKTLDDVAVPQGFYPLFQPIPESDFRVDVSSTHLRANGYTV
jgi:hypothetical protein